MARIVRLLLAALAASALLGGCATSFTLDNRVQAFSAGATLAEPPTYRFERLPSQMADPAQVTVEAMADAALHKAGLRRDDAAPRYSVQLTARVQRVLSPWSHAWDPWGWGWAGNRGWGVGMGWGWGPDPRMESPWFRREVGVLVRELPGNRVIFESHAANDGPWMDNRAVFPAMFEAAMQGFPNPPPGERQVDIVISPRTP